MFSCTEGGDRVRLVELVRGEVEDYIDVLACEDVFGVCSDEWDVELCGTVVCVLDGVRGCCFITNESFLPFLRCRRWLW